MVYGTVRGLRMAVILLALVLVVSRVEAAQEPNHADQNKKPDAIELNRQSGEYYRAGKFKEAAELSRQAYRLNPNPMLLYNLGCACEAMSDYACAIVAYEKYLEQAAPNERQEVQEKIALLRKNLLERQKKVEHQKVEHQKVERRQQKEVESQAGSSEKAEVQSLAKGSMDARNARRKTGYILDAAGGAVLAGGAIVGLLAWKASSDARSAEARSDRDSATKRGKRLGAVADGLFVVGAATLGTGLYYTFSTGSSEKSPALAVMPTSGGGALVLSGKF